MTINEVFPHPTVKQVIFQIRFPNLFYLPSLIGDFQVKVMKDYPESAQFMRKSLLITSDSDQEKLAQLATEAKDDVRQIWHFKSKEGVVLNVTTDSLSLQSDSHKSYRLGEHRFRDAIESACSVFFDVIKLPVVNRIGLRYIDHCPVPDNLSEFHSYYNSTLATGRFPLAEAQVSQFLTVVSRGDHKLRFIETFKVESGTTSMVLDFDAWSANISTDSTIEVTDQLHDLISDEYERTIKEPVIRHMRGSEISNVPVT